MTILPLTYLGSTDYFGLLGSGERGEENGRGGCVVDTGERWVKQTQRNHCEIMTSGGVATLTVPVHGGGGLWNGTENGGEARGTTRIATKDIRIDNSKRWQHTHWTSLVSAYRNSPYFDHYEERFAPLFTSRKFDFLVDLNLELLNIVISALGITSPQISENYIEAGPDDTDLRGKKSLRRENTLYARTPYTQVFCDRHPFVGGLSIVDLLMCEGPGARDWLR